MNNKAFKRVDDEKEKERKTKLVSVFSSKKMERIFTQEVERIYEKSRKSAMIRK